MHLIETRTIPEAHNRIIGLIMAEEEDQLTEDNEIIKQLAEPVCIHITYPEPMTIPGCCFGEKFRAEYIKKVCDITPRRNDGTDATYTYGNRLRDYPRTLQVRKSHWSDQILSWVGLMRISSPVRLGDGNGGGIDQVNGMIARLKHDRRTRRAVAVTWYPEYDISSSDPPCFDLIQASVTFNRLNLLAYARSNDMLSAWGQNAIALNAMQRRIANELSVPVGWLEIISNHPHIYYRRDAFELEQIRKATKVSE